VAFLHRLILRVTPKILNKLIQHHIHYVF